MKSGFLPLSQESVLIGPVAYHDFYGVLVDKAEREIIVKNLGDKHVSAHFLSSPGCICNCCTSLQVMFLRNHGVVAVGRTVEEAFTRIYHVVLACEAQIAMMSAGLDNLVIISQEAALRSAVGIIHT